MVGKILIERIARIPVEVDIASEFRYRDPLVDEDTVVLAISQSGETADTLAAMEEGRRRGATLWSIVNVLGSQAMRLADGYDHDAGRAGDRRGLDQGLHRAAGRSVHAGDPAGRPAPGARRGGTPADWSPTCGGCPTWSVSCLDRAPAVESVARSLKDASHCLYLGRGIQMPIAYEGALKLKEISYIHAEGYPAGEMKHGPIALVDKTMPVVALAPKDPWYEKMISQVEQAKARGGCGRGRGDRWRRAAAASGGSHPVGPRDPLDALHR